MSFVGIYVPVATVFPGVADDFGTLCSLLRTLSRTDTLFWCARLNLVLSNPERHDGKAAQEYAIRRFFTLAKIDGINRFVQEHKDSHVTVFFRGQLLELMRWACILADDHAGDGNTFNDPEVRRRFAQAALIASEVWQRRVYRDRIVLAEDLHAARQRAMPVVRQSVAANRAAVELARMLARSVSIYGDAFHAFYPPAASEFLAATGLTLDQYFACVSAVTIHYANIRPDSASETPGIFDVNNVHQNLRPEMVPVVEKYLSLESQTADELRAKLCKSGSGAAVPMEADSFDYLPLRDRPILRTPAGRSIILDPVFYSEKSSVGPLFAIARKFRGKGKGNTVFGAFGIGFESYVCALLRAMYPSGAGVLSARLSCNIRGRTTAGNDVEIADACLNDVTDVVLFEAKGSFIREDAALDAVEGTYLAAVRANYAQFNVPDERDKGAGQLARAVRDLASDRLAPLSEDLRQAQRIYPVLVVYDTALGGPGHAEFLAEEFAKALEPDEVLRNGYMSKGRFTVGPLVLMTIEDLENLESSVENFRLLDLLRDYTSVASEGARPSLYDFMVVADKNKKYRFIHSRELAGRTMKVLDETAQTLFPDEALADLRRRARGEHHPATNPGEPIADDHGQPDTGDDRCRA